MTGKKIDFEAHRKAKQGDEISGIFDSLNAVAAENIQRLPEDVFVRNFLPMFAGEAVPEHINLSTWFGVAGNPYMPVHVVDKAGEVLYTIPAYFDRGAIDINKVDPRASGLTHVLKTTEQLNRVHPGRARNYFEQQLNMRNMSNEDAGAISRNASVWISIFERYNKPIPPSLQQLQSPAVAPGAQAPAAENPPKDTGLQYDDDIL